MCTFTGNNSEATSMATINGAEIISRQPGKSRFCPQKGKKKVNWSVFNSFLKAILSRALQLDLSVGQQKLLKQHKQFKMDSR